MYKYKIIRVVLPRYFFSKKAGTLGIQIDFKNQI